jgi:hypothetical protein
LELPFAAPCAKDPYAATRSHLASLTQNLIKEV